jgi:hypothetical protein
MKKGLAGSSGWARTRRTGRFHIHETIIPSPSADKGKERRVRRKKRENEVKRKKRGIKN